MRKFTTPSALSSAQIRSTDQPIRVRSEGMNLFDVSIDKFTSVCDIKNFGEGECYLVRRLNSGVEFRSKTLSESKQFIGCFL